MVDKEQNEEEELESRIKAYLLQPLLVVVNVILHLFHIEFVQIVGTTIKN